MPPRNWIDIIKQTAAANHRFAGTPSVIPLVGSKVRVLRGLAVGDVVKVVHLQGSVYSATPRVYIDASDGIPTWYHPWDLEILPDDG